MSQPERLTPEAHTQPVVYETLTSKSLFFSMKDVQSRMHILRPNELQLDYTKIMMGFLLHNPNPCSIAMVGLGGGSLAKFCYRHLPQCDITVVEINPHVIAHRDTFAVPPDDHRFTVRLADAAEYFRDTDEKFDIVLADGFDIDGLPPALCTSQFYDDCYRALNPDGMLVANLHGCHPLFEVVADRLQASFHGALLVVDDPSATNRLAFSVKGGSRALTSLAGVRCPHSFDATAWADLLPSVARVFLASRALARGGAALAQHSESDSEQRDYGH